MRSAVFLIAAMLSGRWEPIFDGASLDGWKAGASPASWTVKDGVIQSDGQASHLFYMNRQCVNCEFKAEVRINRGGSSGMYFRAPYNSDSMPGYRAPIDNANTDPYRTGSLYDFVKELYGPSFPDDTWLTQRIVVEGNRIQIFVNGMQTVDFADEMNSYTNGYLALEQHGPGSVAGFRNVMMRVLPAPHTPLAGTWRLNRERSRFSGASRDDLETELKILDERDGIRYQSHFSKPNAEYQGANYFARIDGGDFRVLGSPAADHVSIQVVERHPLHEALKVARLRKKEDPYVFLVETTKDGKDAGRAIYTVSADGKTLTRQGNDYKEVFEKVE
jgi:hypothetical protein